MAKYALMLLLTGLLAAGCSQENVRTAADLDALQLGPGRLAVSVGGEILTSKQVLEAIVENNGRFVPVVQRFRPIAQTADLENFKLQARAQFEQILTTKISNMLLYQQAKRQLKGKQVDEHLDHLVDDKVRDLIIGQFDGDRNAAEQYLKQNEMDWKSFRQNQKKFMLNQWYLSSRLPKPAPVTSGELRRRYEQLKDESFAVAPEIKFELLDIEVARVNPPDPNKTPLRNARDMAQALLRRAKAGELLSELAEQYLGVSFVKFSEPLNPESLLEPYDILAAKARDINPGDITGPIETNSAGHIFLVKLEYYRPKGCRPLPDVQRQLRRQIIQERQVEATNKVEAEFADQAALVLDNRFTDFCLEKIYRLSKE